jgi:TolB-like protein
MKKFALINLAVLAAATFSFVGCSKRYSNLPAFSAFPIHDSFNYSGGRFKTSYLADQIDAYYRGNSNGPLAVATFVNLDRLYNSSTFGRILGEQLISELAMKGYDVIEMRMADSMHVMNDEGEFGLSRDIRTLRQMQNITGIVVGTYAVSPDRIYVNTRLIDPASSMVVSAGSVEMPVTTEITRLLRNNSFPQAMERIPVRSLGYTYQQIPFWGYGVPTYGGIDPSEIGEMPSPSRPTLELPEPKKMGKEGAKQDAKAEQLGGQSEGS